MLRRALKHTAVHLNHITWFKADLKERVFLMVKNEHKTVSLPPLSLFLLRQTEHVNI